MKRVIEVEGMCCERCAERAEKKLRLLSGVSGAKANFKKGVIFVETELPDEALSACVTEAGFTVKGIDFSPIRGPEGNIEYLGYMQAKRGEPEWGDLEDLVRRSHAQLEGENP